jgi:hypothetical protein
MEEGIHTNRRDMGGRDFPSGIVYERQEGHVRRK